ncbi:MAG: thermonuclease family protein [Nitrospirales bacterium]|nr:thermonuclease family protein [Nitrospirales bacterium]
MLSRKTNRVAVGTILLILLFPIAALSYEARVYRVVDGDSVILLKGGKKVHVRMACIDAPEKKQAYGLASAKALRTKVGGAWIAVNQTDIDEYGLPVVELYRKGLNINEWMISRGLAWHYRQYCPDREDLAYLEARAREQHKGLWKDPAPVAPWIFRDSER